MKMLINSNKDNNCIAPLSNIINDESLDSMVYDDAEKCELLNKYFIAKLDEENVAFPEFDRKTEDRIHNIAVTESEIIDIINILDVKKATGPDEISHKSLEISPDRIAKPLQIIFNKSLQQRKYPICWKLSHVIPIFKKGGSSLPSNYRPISLISCVGKIIERVLYKHVYNHLVQNKLIYQYQSGFFAKTFHRTSALRSL